MNRISASLRGLSVRRFTLAVVLLYLTTRAVSATIIGWAAGFQVPNVTGWSDADPGYEDLVTMWDSRWYERIADGGYPKTLPTDGEGQVRQNAWAFYPVFPVLARTLMMLTTLPWEIVAPTLSLALGAGAAVVMSKIATPRLGRYGALATVGLWGVYPAAPSLQMAYTESAAALVLCIFLLYVDRREWLWAGLAALVMGITRPIGAPLVLVIGIAVLWQWLEVRRNRSELPPWFYARAGGGVLAAAAGTLLWPAVTAAVTGVFDGYTRTQASWRAGGDLALFSWPRVMSLWLDKIADAPITMGWLFTIVAFGLVAVAVAGPWARRLGPAMTSWVIGYAIYLLVMIEPYSSTIRFMLLAFPLGAIASGFADESRPSRLRLVVRTSVVAVVFLALQVWWVREFLVFDPPTDLPP